MHKPYPEKKVLVIGDAGVDIIVPFPKFHNEERTDVEFQKPVVAGGGTAANTAVALQRLDVDTAFLGTIGKDRYGKFVMEELEKEGIDISPLIVDENLYTFTIFAFVDEYGERYPLLWPETDLGFQTLDMEKTDIDSVLEYSWIHSSGITLMEDTSARHSIIDIFKKASEAGIPTSFDLNLRVSEGSIEEEYKQAVLEVMKYCDYVLGSGEDEFYYLDPQEDWMASVKSLAHDHHTLIARMGEKGSLAMTGRELVEAESFSVEVEDTVGAGDAYNAGFIAAKLMQKNMKDCLVTANAVAAYSVTKEGARSSPAKEELRRFLNE